MEKLRALASKGATPSAELEAAAEVEVEEEETEEEEGPGMGRIPTGVAVVPPPRVEPFRESGTANEF